MVAPQTFNLEETISLISEKARALKESGRPPLFELTLSRRNASGVPQQLASFAQATLEHIQDPVRWLPQLCGGGEYIINVRHEDISGRIGGPIGVNFDKAAPGMEPRSVDPRVARSPHWSGPALSGGAFLEPTGPQPHAGATAMPWSTPNGVQVTGGYTGPNGSGAVVGPQVDREREMATQLADLRAQLARTEAEGKARTELEAERRANEARLREMEQRADRERRESETRMAAQIADMRAAQATAAAAQPRVDPADGWKSLITVIMPLVQQMLTSQHEMRIMMMKTSDENARRSLEAAEKQHQAQMEMIKAITAQKPGMSEEMRMLIGQLSADKKDNGADAIAAMLTRQMEAMGMMMKMSTGMIETVADLQMGDSEHPVVGAIREAAMAMKTMMSGANEGAKKIVQKKLPPGQPQMTPQQAAQLRQQQLAQQQARARQAQAAAVAGRQAPPKPAGPTVVNVPQAPAPAPAPVPVTKFEAPPAPVPVAVPAEVVPGVTHFEVLKAGIHNLKPAEEVVDFFVRLKNADEPSLKEALDKHGGSPWDLLKAEFGMKFISANMSYFEELGETIDARGVTEGWWAADEGEADDDEGPSHEAVADEAVEDQIAASLTPVTLDPTAADPIAITPTEPA